MKKNIKKYIHTFGVILLLTAASNRLSSAEFYVALDGQDSNPGTMAEPFATLQRAQVAVRDIKFSNGLDKPSEIILRGGIYYLNEMLYLTPEDSGTATSPITWRSAEGETVVLSGGRPIKGKWTTDDGTIWYVDIPSAQNSEWNFRQLFVVGQRTPRARYPNASEANPFLYATDGSMSSVMIEKGLVKASWGEGDDVQINIVPDWKFYNQWNTVKGVNPEIGEIYLENSELFDDIIEGNWFWIEGVREEMDDRGEWYLDRSEGRLYYIPLEGIDPNDIDIVAPYLNRIVYAKGDVEKGTHVEYVNFKGLEFHHTTFSLGHIEARVHTDAAVMLENASNCSVSDSIFENIGGYALWMHLDSQRNVFTRNQVYHSGGGGVLATGARFSYMDESKIYTPGEKAAEAFPILNSITHNVVKHCGKIRYYGGGVHLDSRPFSMSMSPGNYIAHNYFEDLSRNGIFAFRNQGGNVVEYNEIHDTMQTTIDGACIHFATMNRLNAPNYILNNYLYDIWGYEQMPDGKPVRLLANGIFLDWATSNTTVENNYIYNAGGKAIKPIMGNWNINISKNFVSDTKITPPFIDEVGPGGTASHAIDLESNRLTGRVIHYSSKDLVSYSGQWEPRMFEGFRNLFSFKMLEAGQSEKAEIKYTLPIVEKGIYQISLLYLPSPENATNAKIEIGHAEGVSAESWDLSAGDQFGFAVEVGQYYFEPGKPAHVTISNEYSDGVVLADSIGFVKISERPKYN